MRYQLKPIFCRPWLLNGLSLKGGHSGWKAIGGRIKPYP